MMKKLLKKIPAVLLAVCLIISAVPATVFASGSYAVSTTSITVTQGSSKTFTFTATNAVGAFEISTDGGVTASCSGDAWVDNSSVTITVKGNTVGTGHVYISVYDGADYDGNDLSGKSYTVTVTVTSASGGTVSETTTVSQTEATTTTQETTTADPEIELLTVTIDETGYLVVKTIAEDDIPDGFEIEETDYNTVTVQTLVCDDMVLYMLKNTSDGTSDYYTLSSSGTFELLKYTTLGKKMCIFLDFPDDLDIPYGYTLVEAEICGVEGVEALVVDESILESVQAQEETSSEETSESDGDEGADETGSEVEAKTFYTVSATLIDELAAPTEGHYFVYCLLAGEKMLCDYDSSYETLQRCTAVLEISEPETETETETQIAEEEPEEDDSLMKILKAALMIAGVIIVALIALLLIFVVFKGRRKKSASDEDLDDIEFEEEDILYGDEPEISSFESEGNEEGFAAEEPSEEETEELEEEEIADTEEEAEEEAAEEEIPDTITVDEFSEELLDMIEEEAEGDAAIDGEEEIEQAHEENIENEEASYDDIKDILADEFTDMEDFLKEEE